ncbi:cobalt ECF transporter T component CbiQ [Lysinibacillus endophyticus]|uniref:cobalt ECF transporter T component CbiQ n=1 Tax=Ureibacillus endophyticus TaxID=1978490 RepID=UPI00209D233C|nr:cobalt ECF transporter T component CbiQ [Lysinibacillus endophyticus]MCP1144460.1 cobalt ECF transporter T component CbiQ [Lysinibacillus endophyticus]
MLNIDNIAHQNALQKVAASQKLIISLCPLFMVTISRNNSIALWTLLFMSSVIVFYAKVPWKVYATLILAPLGFSLAGIVTIIVSISFSGDVPDNSLWKISTFFVVLYILPSDLWRALNIFLVAFSSTSCLYLLILTTPIYEISPLLKKCKLPTVVIELIELIYRFIFIFLQTSLQLHTAQQARLGYKNYKVSFQSLVLLISALFRSIFIHYEKMVFAMKARNIEEFIIPDVYLTKYKWQSLLSILIIGYLAIAVILLIL